MRGDSADAGLGPLWKRCAVVGVVLLQLPCRGIRIVLAPPTVDGATATAKLINTQCSKVCSADWLLRRPPIQQTNQKETAEESNKLTAASDAAWERTSSCWCTHCRQLCLASQGIRRTCGRREARTRNEAARRQLTQSESERSLFGIQVVPLVSLHPSTTDAHLSTRAIYSTDLPLHIHISVKMYLWCSQEREM